MNHTELRRLLKKGMKGTITHDEHAELHSASAHWASCGVGENKERLEKLGYKFVADSSGEKVSPTDTVLTELGMDFYHQVGSREYKTASATLKTIDNYGKQKKGRSRKEKV